MFRVVGWGKSLVMFLIEEYGNLTLKSRCSNNTLSLKVYLMAGLPSVGR